MSSSRIVVAVRVRPLSKKERRAKERCVVQTAGPSTLVAAAQADGAPRRFTFDHSLWSGDADAGCGEVADQAAVFEALGRPVVDNALEGYNASVFAYGQTGSGKTHTMMGADSDHGLIPRLCKAVFAASAARSAATPGLTCEVEASYMEIYNEHVHDLLHFSGKRLAVREHKLLGPYVENLSSLAVANYRTIEKLMARGNNHRSTAATNMNETSSRSHAVFVLTVHQVRVDPETQQQSERVSRVSLVDLAGSERQSKSGATGERLAEAANINKSLTTLGRVIHALAQRSAAASKPGAAKPHIPYRESVLTWLLKESLGGNSKTVMITTVSPAASNIEETLSSLRYADHAKQIVNVATVNEDATAALIRGLREEVTTLRARLAGSDAPQGTAEEAAVLESELQKSEALMAQRELSWREKLEETQLALQESEERARAELQSLKVSMRWQRAVSLSASQVLQEQLQREEAMLAKLRAAKEEAVMRAAEEHSMLVLEELTRAEETEAVKAEAALAVERAEHKAQEERAARQRAEAETRAALAKLSVAAEKPPQPQPVLGRGKDVGSHPVGNGSAVGDGADSAGGTTFNLFDLPAAPAAPQPVKADLGARAANGVGPPAAAPARESAASTNPFAPTADHGAVGDAGLPDSLALPNPFTAPQVPTPSAVAPTTSPAPAPIPATPSSHNPFATSAGARRQTAPAQQPGPRQRRARQQPAPQAVPAQGARRASASGVMSAAEVERLKAEAGREAVSRQRREEDKRQLVRVRRLAAIRAMALGLPVPPRSAADLRGLVAAELGGAPALSDCTLSPTECMGFLVKQGGLRHNWKRRWFVLDLRAGSLAYYTGSDQHTEKGVVPLRTIAHAVSEEAMTVTDGQLNPFAIVTPTRTYHCQAPTAAARRIWLIVLNAVAPPTTA